MNALNEANDPISVLVIGAGGNGSNIVPELGKIHATLLLTGATGLMVTVIDADKVEIHNTGRQKFAPSDVGRYKAEVIVERVNRFYGTKWNSVHSMFDPEKLHLRYNIIITCVDNLKIRRDVWNICKKQQSFYDDDIHKKYWWVDLGNGQYHSQVLIRNIRSLKKDNTKCIFEMNPHIREKVNQPSCSMEESLLKQSLFINSMTAQFAGMMIYDVCTLPHPKCSATYIDLENFTVNSKKYELTPDHEEEFEENEGYLED
jgi:PRTRC genetic system ThiF family protein